MRLPLISLFLVLFMHAAPAGASNVNAPELTLSTQVVEFGTIFAGTSILRTLTVTNTGTDPLILGPLATTPDSIFAGYYQDRASQGSFSLWPGERQTIVVMFSTSGVNSYEGMLTITSNVPQKTVRLTGMSVLPPEMDVSPESFSVDVEAGSRTDRTLTIANTGFSDLEFSILPLPPSRTGTGDAGKSGPILGPPPEIHPNRYPIASLRNENVSTQPPTPAALRDVAGPGLLFGVVNQSIAELDISTGAVLNTIMTVGYTDGSEGLAYDGRYLYYNGSDDGSTSSIIRIDVSTLETDTAHINIGYIDGLAHSGSMLYALGYVYGLIFAIDFESETIVDYITPDVDGVYGGLTFGGTRQTLFVTRFQEILEVDVVTGEIINTFQGPEEGYGLTYSNTLEALILAAWSGYYYVLDPDDGSVIDRLNGLYSNALAGDESGRAPFVDVTPSEGAVAAGESIEVTVGFDAKELFAGTHSAQMRLYTNEPRPQPAQTILATVNVTGEAILDHPDSLRFSNTYVGTSSTREFRISNAGTDTLIVSDLAIQGADFGMYPLEQARIEPGGDEAVFIRYEPLAVGTSEGALTITSNVGESTVQLVGQASEAPVVGMRPDSLWTSIYKGHQVSHSVIIRNDGGSTLEWETVAVPADGGTVLQQSPQFEGDLTALRKEVGNTTISTRHVPFEHRYAMGASSSAGYGAAAPAASLEEVLQIVNANAQSLASLIPNRFDFTEGDVSYFIEDGGGDMYDWGNQLTTDRDSNYIEYTGGLIRTASAFGGGARNYFTQKVPGLFVLAADLDNVSWFEISGNLGADGSGSVDGSILETTVDGVPYQIFIKRVYNAGDPSVNHMLIVDSRVGAAHEFSQNSDDDFHRLYDLDTADRLYYLLYAGDLGAYIGNDAALNIANAFLGELRVSPPWISIEPSAGSVAAGDSMAIDIRFDATDLEEGRYRAELLTTGNGLDSTATRIPITMDVLLNVSVESPDVPVAFALEAGYPNPVGVRGTTIKYALPRAAAVRLTVYDTIGRHVATLVDEQQSARWHEVHFDAAALPNGLYVYLLEAGDYRNSRSMVVLR